MTKNKLIELLQSIQGNPEVRLECDKPQTALCPTSVDTMALHLSLCDDKEVEEYLEFSELPESEYDEYIPCVIISAY